MELLKLLLDWSAAIAWPFVIFIIVILFRQPLLMLLERIGAIAERAEKEAFDLQIGEQLKISFSRAIEKANPQTVKQAIEIAEQEAEKVLNIFDSLNRIPFKQHHKDLLLKIAKGGEEGTVWHYKGNPDISPGRTVGFLLSKNLVRMDGDRYFVHPAVREYIFQIHGNFSGP